MKNQLGIELNKTAAAVATALWAVFVMLKDRRKELPQAGDYNISEIALGPAKESLSLTGYPAERGSGGALWGDALQT
jgi:hypothetical protein